MNRLSRQACLRNAPPLSREEERELSIAARRGDQAARARLVTSSLRHVVAIASQYRRYPVRFEDLLSEGHVGLMTAVDKFDPDRGTRFVTYAGYWIRAYVLDFIVRSTSMVGAGSGPLRSKLFFRLRRERARLTNLVPDARERNAVLATQFGVSEERMASMLERLDGRDVSLDRPVFDDAPTSLLDRLVDPRPLPDETLDEVRSSRVRSDRVARALQRLDRRERLIVERRLLSEEEASLAELGRSLGISRERARQLEARARKKLRAELQDLVAA
ncbi:MAG: sigma-70 family RNA polymerase sigma factor [Myxococcota bacterium]|nr:sigma-70 family RNA polymerase sigma factor [Myxococcota bacterium]MDW8361991.1 sigma-70 family RNA polymerase sigma factor [Myxococcales bacterium]